METIKEIFMRQKEIYWAQLDPVEGKEQGGRRPVVIISGNTMNKNCGIFIVCPISSKIKYYEDCVILRKDKINRLRYDSEIITFQVRTIAKNRFDKKIGQITDAQLNDIFRGLINTLTY